MKEAVSGVDVAALAAEFRVSLVGGRMDKAYQPAKDQILLRFRGCPAGRQDVLFQLGKFVTVTQHPPSNPNQPSMVAKVLRQRLGNARLVGVSQLGFDRLLRFDFERGEGPLSLVMELFGEGNLLLLGADDDILLPMRGQDHGARRLRRGETYQRPPGSEPPFGSPLEAFAALGKQGKKDVIRFLAVDLGFGPVWAKQLCLRADVAKNTKVGEATNQDWQALHAEVERLGNELERNDLAPVVAFEGEEMVDCAPFVLSGLVVEEYPTFTQALDRFFIGETGEELIDPRQAKFDADEGKLLRQMQQIDDSLATFKAEEDARRADGDALYHAFQQVQTILDGLHQQRERMSWADIEAILATGRSEGHPFAQNIPALNPNEATATLRLETPEGYREVQVDVRKTVQDNATRHYDAAKKAKSRQQGAMKARPEMERKLAALRQKGLDGYGKAPEKKEGPSRHFWFESYRWTVTPSGMIAAGGRNASQNDAVVKKYMRDGDRYVHADIHGAPSVILRVEGEPKEEDLQVACQFAAAASRAWRQFAQASAYWVTPQQVSKTPRSGEFVPKGAWIVHGRRNTLGHLPMEWVVAEIGFQQGGIPDKEGPIRKITGGPRAGLEPFASRMVALIPGAIEPNPFAKELAEEWQVDIEAIQAALPPGAVGRA